MPICWGGREKSLIFPSTTHPAPSNMQCSSIGKINYHQLRCFTLLCFELHSVALHLHVYLFRLFFYRLVEFTRKDGTSGRRVRPYIIDLGSGNGTYLNNQRIDAQRYYELKEKDVIKFGFSSREYVLLHEFSDTTEVDAKQGEEEDDEGLDE